MTVAPAAYSGNANGLRGQSAGQRAQEATQVFVLVGSGARDGGGRLGPSAVGLETLEMVSY